MRVWLVVMALCSCDAGKQPERRGDRNDRPTPVARDAGEAVVLEDAAASGIQVWNVGDSPMSIAVVDGYLFWTNSAGALWSMPARGGKAHQLSDQHDPGQPFFQNIAAHNDELVAAMKGDLARIKPARGPVVPLNLGLGTDQLLELVSDGTHVYATSYETQKIYKIGTAAAPAKATKLIEHRRTAIDVEGDTLYALSYATGALVAVKTSGGAPRTIATGLPKPTGFATDATSAYAWCEKDRVLRKIDLATGKVSVLATDGMDNSDTIVEDGEWLYLVTWHGPGGGKVLRVAKDGSKTEVVADKLSAPYDIDVDDDAIYFSVRDDGNIVRIEKAAIKAL